MKKLISAQKAANFIFAIFGLLLLTHILIIAQVLPYTIVWGGQLEKESVLPLELISIVFLFSFALIVLIKLKYLKDGQTNKMITIGLWFMVLYFLFNTLANFESGVKLENLIFGPVSFILSLLTMRLAIEK